MAATQTDTQTDSSGSEQIVPDWVFLIPGLLLVIIGFGGLIFLSVV